MQYTVTVENNTGSQAISINSSTKLLKAAKTNNLSEISGGDMVFVSYKDEAGLKTAAKISVRVKKASEVPRSRAAGHPIL